MDITEYYVSIKNTLEQETKKFEDEGYKPVITTVQDPKKSIINHKMDRCGVRITYCQHRDTCEAYKKGLCINAGNIIFATYCIFSKTYTLEGLTQRSQYYQAFVNAANDVLKIDYNKIYRRIDKLRETIRVGDGSMVFVALSHLDNYVNPCLEELNGQKENFIPYDVFAKEETIKFLLDYKPLALSGGEITTYQTNDIPKFIRNLKTNFVDLYNQVIKGSDYERTIPKERFTGKRAVLSTLKPGKVKTGISTEPWNWDGEVLTSDKIFGIDAEKIVITPKPEAIVFVVDEDTVDENTDIRY